VPIQITVTGDLHIHLADLTADQITTPILAALASAKGAIMTDVDDALATVTAEFDTLRADIDRELADFLAAHGGTMSAETRAAFDALSAKFASATSAVDAADPVPPVV
jgi:hypothetical protein